MNRPIDGLDIDGLEFLKAFWNFAKMLGYENSMSVQHSDDIQEEAMMQQEQASARNATKEVEKKLDKLYEGQKNIFGWVPGADLWFNAADYKLGKQSGQASIVWAGISFIPIELPSVVKKYMLKGVKRALESVPFDYHDLGRKIVTGERVKYYKELGERVAEENGWIYRNDLKEVNDGRRIYEDKKNKRFFGLDTEKGSFEVHDKKGTHQGEIDFFGTKLDDADASRRHNIKTKR